MTSHYQHFGNNLDKFSLFLRKNVKISPGINVSFCIEDSIILVTKIVDDIWTKPLFNDNFDIGVEALRYLFGLVDPERMELDKLHSVVK